MKLVKLLGLVAVGGLFAVGCSSTDTSTTDAGKTDSGTDTFVPPTDTPAETVAETPADTGEDCPTCTTKNCSTEFTTCSADTTCKKGIDCFNACPSPDPGNTCHNACISDNPDPTGSTKFTDLVTCLSSKCKAACLPG